MAQRPILVSAVASKNQAAASDTLASLLESSRVALDQRQGYFAATKPGLNAPPATRARWLRSALAMLSEVELLREPLHEFGLESALNATFAVALRTTIQWPECAGWCQTWSKSYSPQECTSCAGVSGVEGQEVTRDEDPFGSSTLMYRRQMYGQDEDIMSIDEPDMICGDGSRSPMGVSLTCERCCSDGTPFLCYVSRGGVCNPCRIKKVRCVTSVEEHDRPPREFKTPDHLRGPHHSAGQSPTELAPPSPQNYVYDTAAKLASMATSTSTRSVPQLQETLESWISVRERQLQDIDEEQKCLQNRRLDIMAEIEVIRSLRR